MKNWGFVVAGLYGLILVVLTVPVTALAFVGNAQLKEVASLYLYGWYWLWIAVMVLAQAALLVVPVRVASRRPVTRRSLTLPLVIAGLMMGGLAVGGLYSICEFIFSERCVANWALLGSGAVGLLLWVIWGFVFSRLGKNIEPEGVISRHCRLMLEGSILELLIAVPTHIVARYRNYCCAGFMTFIGITLGISVMLFSFGPAVFFLYLSRWRRLRPDSPISQL